MHKLPKNRPIDSIDVNRLRKNDTKTNQDRGMRSGVKIELSCPGFMILMISELTSLYEIHS